MSEQKNPTEKYITQRAYAKHRGTALSTIIDCLKSGRISTSLTPKGLKRIDWKKCDADWLANTDQGKDPTKDDPKKQEDIKGPSFAQSRALKEAYLARIKKLEYEEKDSLLVKRDVMLKALQTIAFSIKEQLRTIPQKVSATFAAETDPRIIEITLMKEIDQTLEGLQSLKDKI